MIQEKPAYAPTAKLIGTAMKAYIAKHEAGEKNLQPMFDEIELNYNTAVSAGWTDWENDLGRYLPMFRRWARESSE